MFDSVRDILELELRDGEALWQGIRRVNAENTGITVDQSDERMRRNLEAMQQALTAYDPAQRSRSGLVGGDSEKLQRYVESGSSIGGDFVGQIIRTALCMGECNACMHRIVAAPTAGSCGVLPSVLLPYAVRFSVSEDELLHALYVASAFGCVIASRASISGAEAGCQAEIGSASAMAAAALVYLHGGDAEKMAHAVAIALKNLMGLVCDPVAGLVEVPCVKRNVIGAMDALSAADMALAGIRSAIPADEVIDAMLQVGRNLPASLRETGEGGVAATPTARRFQKDFFGE